MTKLQRKIIKYRTLIKLRKANWETLNLIDECISQVRYERRFEKECLKND